MDEDDDTLDLTEALAELHEATEPCDCPWHRRADAATRLCTGSAALARRAGAWVTAEDWRTALVRVGVLSGGTYAAFTLAERQPLLVPAATAAWCIAAWRATGSVPANEPLSASCDEYRQALLDWLHEAIGDRRGIHLSEAYSRLRERPALAHLTDEQLRATFDHYGIPTRRQIRVGDIGGRAGIHIDDLKDPSCPKTQIEPPPTTPGEQ